jgi:hypothetical protein
MFSVAGVRHLLSPPDALGRDVLGAVSGGILTAGVGWRWTASGIRLGGGLVGLIAGGMISFIVFKIAVILFTSLAEAPS